MAEKEDTLLDRSMYKEIKNMNRSTMEKAIRNIYQLGYDAALKENAVDFNIDGLREELHQIKGIGETRFNLIMSVIEKYMLNEVK